VSAKDAEKTAIHRPGGEEVNRIAAVAAITLFAACATLPAQAQQYPSKPIRIVVPYAAGGTSDILARQIGPKLTEA
jgi:tripartite-type tricarboxylate transporter receptor subunit TctC